MGTIKAKGSKPAIKFKSGGLHASLGAKPGAKLTSAQHAKARSGAAGKKAEKQELFFENVLHGGGRRAARKLGGK